MRTTAEQSSEAPKSREAEGPTTAELATSHEAVTKSATAGHSLVKVSEAATPEAEQAEEQETAPEREEHVDEEDVDEEIHLEGPYEVPPSPPPRTPSPFEFTSSPPPIHQRRKGLASQSTPTGKGVADLDEVYVPRWTIKRGSMLTNHADCREFMRYAAPTAAHRAVNEQDRGSLCHEIRFIQTSITPRLEVIL